MKTLPIDSSEDWDPVGQWTPRYQTDAADSLKQITVRYGSVDSYRLAAVFLEDCKEVEDWGCGFGDFRKFCLSPKYIGLDGSESPAAHAVVDLRKYTSNVEGILVRHVLEHNPAGWRQIFMNALESFSKRMVLVIYTPFGDVTRNLRRQSPGDIRVPVALSFQKDDIVGCIPPHVSWFTVVGEPIAEYETMFFLQKGGERLDSSSNQEIAYFPNFDGDL